MALYRNILVAVDFSPAAEVVGRRALELAGCCGGRLGLIHVVEYLPPLELGYDPVVSPDWVTEENQMVERAKESLAEFVKRLGIDDARQWVVLGAPKAEIVRVAEEYGADLIVMGSHGRHGISRLLGSTADAVLHNAPCDVLAVRIRE